MNTSPYFGGVHPRIEMTVEQSFYKWRVERGLSNGTERVKARRIYEDYKNWAKDKISYVPSLMRFFLDFQKFAAKRQRYTKGIHYFLNKQL